MVELLKAIKRIYHSKLLSYHITLPGGQIMDEMLSLSGQRVLIGT